MGRERGFLLHICYALTGLAAGLMLPGTISGITVLTSVLTGFSVFLAGSVLHEWVVRRAWQRRADMQMRALKRAYDDLRDEIFSLRDDTMSILKALNIRAKSKVVPHVSETKKDEAKKAVSVPADSAGSGADVVIAGSQSSVSFSDEATPSQPGAGPSVLYGNLPGRSRPRSWFGMGRSRQISAKQLLPHGTKKPSGVFRQAPAAANSLDLSAVASVPGSEAATQTLNHVREMLRHSRIVHKVQPIVDLSSRQPHFYECFSYVPAMDHKGLLPLSGLSHFPEHQSLLAGIDRVVLSNVIEIINRLRDYDPQMQKIFINVSPSVMHSGDVFERLVAMVRSRPQLKQVMVLDISHDDVVQRRVALRDLENFARVGFALSLQNVMNLSKDLNTAVLENFQFLKVAASVIDEVAMAQGKSSLLSDFQALRRLCLQNDVKLVVEKVESLETADRAAELGVHLGMGFALGRPSHLDLLAGISQQQEDSTVALRQAANS